MRILIQTPAKTGSKKGNRITALRWARILRELNHQVVITSEASNKNFDLMIALHAVKSANAIARFRRTNPNSKIFLALTGTDVYSNSRANTRDNAPEERGRFLASLESASRIIVLNHDAESRLPKKHKAKSVVILQSSVPPKTIPPPLKRSFEVVVAGHLRDVKAPFLTPIAARSLPDDSRIRITHVGKALSAKMRQEAVKETTSNSRYRWLGEKTHGETKRLIARAKLLVVSSHIEGGSAVISEALVSGTPVLATRIPGIEGMLGKDYPGLFGAGDREQLKTLMRKSETSSNFYKRLKTSCRQLAPQFHPKKEKQAWQLLLHTSQHDSPKR